jgi:hypothetical protein
MMVHLQGITNLRDHGLLSSIVSIAVEDLEDSQPPHRHEFIEGRL